MHVLNLRKLGALALCAAIVATQRANVPILLMLCMFMFLLRLF